MAIRVVTTRGRAAARRRAVRRAVSGAVAAPAVAAAAWILPAAAARAAGPLPPLPPGADARLVRVTAGLARDPLYVDPDVAAGIGAAQHAGIEALIRTTARALRVPVYVVVIPNPEESESQGKAVPFLAGLHDRLRRDGLYLMVDDGGYIAELPYRVPRDVPDVPWDLERPGNVDHGLADVATRLGRVLAAARTAPSAQPSPPFIAESAAPFGQENPPPPKAEPAIAGPFAAGLLFAGPVGAFVLYGLYRLAGAAAHRVRRTAAPAARTATTADPGAPARPSPRWLRRTATAEVNRLHAELTAGVGATARTATSTAAVLAPADRAPDGEPADAEDAGSARASAGGDDAAGSGRTGRSPAGAGAETSGLVRRMALPHRGARRRGARGRGEGRAYALAAYDAAQVLSDDVGVGAGEDDADRLLDLAGVIVLARLGRAALAAGTAHPAPPCFVNPLHGPGAERRPLPAAAPERPSGRFPMCPACAAAPADRLVRAIMSVPGVSGPVPHYAVPGVWAATGFGARTADLPARILEHLDVD